LKKTSLLCALAAVLVAAAPGVSEADAAAAPSPWSAPARLGTCAALGAAQAAFPRDEPAHATGAGAVVWSASSACPGGAGTMVAPIGPNDEPQAPHYALTGAGERVRLRPPLAVAPAPHGEIAIAGSASSPARRDGALVQGTAGGPFARLGALAGASAPGTLATGYLGDVAAVWATGGGGPRGGVRVDVERYFAHALSAPRIVPSRAGAVQSPTVSLDYRTDAIVVWRQAGALLARELPGRGGARPTQRLASVGANVHVAALISDDGRAIVVWTDERAGRTSVYLDASGAGVSFGAPQLLERFANPGGVADPEGSPQLVRLSSESVMLAWSGAQGGDWAVRAAAIDLNGIGRVSTISAPGAEALLSDLAPGPDGEAIAVWSEPRPSADRGSTSGTLDLDEQAIVAARGIDAYPDATIFAPPAQLAPPGANSAPTIAFDPESDGALVLWRGTGGAIEYAMRAGARP
jgi:hypothetical protein